MPNQHFSVPLWSILEKVCKSVCNLPILWYVRFGWLLWFWFRLPTCRGLTRGLLRTERVYFSLFLGHEVSYGRELTHKSVGRGNSHARWWERWYIKKELVVTIFLFLEVVMSWQCLCITGNLHAQHSVYFENSPLFIKLDNKWGITHKRKI